MQGRFKYCDLGGVLCAIELPRGGGGETGFIDRINAYNVFPDELKARIKGEARLREARPGDACEMMF